VQVEQLVPPEGLVRLQGWDTNMPQYVSLADQGFYVPFQMLGQGLAARRDRKDRQKQLAWQQEMDKDQLQTSKLQRTHLQAQIDDLKPQTPVIPAGMEEDGLSVDPRGRVQTMYRRKAVAPPTPEGMIATGMQSNGRDQTWTFGQKPTLPAGIGSDLTVRDVVFDGSGPPRITYRPKITAPGTQIVEEALPNGGKGLFLKNVDAETGKTTLTPYNKRSEQEQRVGNELMQKLNITALALSQLPKLEEAVANRGDAGGPVVSKLTAPFHWAFGPSQDRLQFDLLKSQTLAPVAKGILGETGALSEADMARYAPQFPGFEDTQDVRKFKVEEMRRLIEGQRNSILNNLKAAGYDVDELMKTPGLQAPNGASRPPEEQIKADFKAGKLTREQAKAALTKLGFK
jgi:hypothetical protein